MQSLRDLAHADTLQLVTTTFTDKYVFVCAVCAELAHWLEPAGAHNTAEHLYVVDPMGHLMMRFPARMDIAGAGKAKRDLERLMRASSSWDEAGR